MCTFKHSDSQFACQLCLEVPAIQVLPTVPFFFEKWMMSSLTAPKRFGVKPVFISLFWFASLLSQISNMVS